MKAATSAERLRRGIQISFCTNLTKSACEHPRRTFCVVELAMDLNLAMSFGRELMDAYGLRDWRLCSDAAVRRFGSCNYDARRITLSAPLVTLNSECEVLNCLLHEIAHGLVGPKHGHDETWRRVARGIGCTGDRCYSSERVVQPHGRYVLLCKNCGRTSERVRKPSSTLACGNCCRRLAGGKFDARFILVYCEFSTSAAREAA